MAWANGVSPRQIAAQQIRLAVGDLGADLERQVVGLRVRLTSEPKADFDVRRVEM
jgi:hypothetical protein